MSLRRTVSLLVLLTAAAAPAQKPEEKKKPGDERIEKYLAKETERLSQRVLDGAKTRAEWEKKRPRLRREYLDMLGLWPLPEKTPLKATVTGTVERANYGVVIEKLHFQSKPGLYVTGNLYRPKASKGKLPAVLYVCGHAWKGRDGNKSAHQDHGLRFATNGYVCLVIDSLQLGEIPGVHHGTYGTPYRHFGTYGLAGKDVVENRWWWQAAGYTPAGVECWNGIRAIDYLISRPDVDADKIAVTGISGGGAATFWIAAADERVKCAVPVSGMSDLESYVTNKVINNHCDCMMLINTYQWEWTTIAALVAPRPLLFANSDADPIFPMDGNRRIIARLRTLYKLYDKPDLVDDYVSKGGHAYRPDLRVAVFKWINKHVKGDTGPVKDADFKDLPGKELRVFPEEKDVPKDALNGKIDETFVPRARVKLPAKGEFEEWKKGLMKELRGRVFRALPEQVPSAEYLGKGPQALPWPTWQVEPGIVVRTPEWNTGKEGSRQATLVILNDEYFKKAIRRPELDRLLGDGYAAGLYTRGAPEATGWERESPPNTVERSLALLGQTVDLGRVRDVIAVLRKIDSRFDKKRDWKVVGVGQAGVLAAYAALFEPGIKEVVIIDPPTSHKDGPIFLNVLRVLDVPEALGLLAPHVKLTLVNAKDKAFDRTAEIYKLAGAADKLQRK
jgi:cephalosporin-C deacetylase-like acetyl esterase